MLVTQSALSVKEHGLRPLVGSRDGLNYTVVTDRSIRALKQHAHFAGSNYSTSIHARFAFGFHLNDYECFKVVRCGESIVLRNISAWVFLDKKLPLVDRSFVHRLFVRDLLKPVANS
jgi:hypothetical protein